MQALIKRLRTLGPVGEFIANLLSFLTANWVMVVSTLAAMWVALWESAVTVVSSPRFLAAAVTFFATLWTALAFMNLAERRRMRRQLSDYSYGLTFAGVHPNYRPDQKDAALQFSILFVNHSLPGAIQYRLERFDVQLGTRALPRLRHQLGGSLPRGSTKGSRNVPFTYDDIKEFIGWDASGTVSFAVVYGHPEREPARRFEMEIEIQLSLQEDGRFGYVDTIISERDVPA